jgi:capsid protein
MENRTGTRTQVTTGTGTAITLEQVYGSGSIPTLNPGKKLKLVADASPHPNQLSLLDYLIRDIAWGAGLSPEIIWNIAALGGANTRFVLADAQGWIEQQQQRLIDTYCARVWIYTLAKEMKAGRLPQCQDTEWWKHTWITPARVTVDFGRDGKLHLEQLKSGALTLKDFYGWQGKDSGEQIKTWLDEVADIKAGLNAANASARTEDDRNLTWADLAAWRNINAQPQHDAPAALGEDGLPTDSAAAQAALATLLKNPAKAQALMEQLSAAA